MDYLVEAKASLIAGVIHVKDLVVGVSARHIHLNQETFMSLFGEEATLHKLKDLRQPGAYSCMETVQIGNSRYSFGNVRVLGPFKSENQIEISSSDAYFFGMNAPINKSGDFRNAGTLDVTVDNRTILLSKAVIIPQRHIHVSYAEAERRGWREDQKVSVLVEGIRGGILHNVHIRTGDYKLELHVDLDDGNAFGIHTGDRVEIIP